MTIQVVDHERLRELCERYGIASLEVFGSVARGEDLTEGLSEVLGRRVDLVSRRAIHRRMRDHVLAEAELFYAA